MCGDHRPLNQVTPQDKYPMPILEEIFDNIGDSNCRNPILAKCGGGESQHLEKVRFGVLKDS